MTKTPSLETQFDIALGNHALGAQPTKLVSYAASLPVGCAGFQTTCRLLANKKTDNKHNG